MSGAHLSQHLTTLALLFALGWGCLACLIPFVRLPWRATALWGVVALGVPTLGFLTFVMGPLAGVAALALGLATLVWSPLDAIRRRRAHGPDAHSAAE